MNERERLMKVIETEGMTAKQFAEEIGVGAGTISNITGGRNNPSLEVLQKVLHRFRHINAQWLILGTGTMYITSPSGEPDLFNTNNPNSSNESNGANGLTDFHGSNGSNGLNGSNLGDVVAAISNAMSSAKDPSFSSSSVETVIKEVPVAKTIQRIVIFYTDGTFEER